MRLAAIANQQRREAMQPITFAPARWAPQVRVTFTRDVNGWLDRDHGVKWHFAAGSTHMVDEQHAVEFIVKGYATGEAAAVCVCRREGRAALRDHHHRPQPSPPNSQRRRPP